jgi:hypothetical protein
MAGRSFAVDGFWVLWDNIYKLVLAALDFPVILDSRFNSKWRFEKEAVACCKQLYHHLFAAIAIPVQSFRPGSSRQER